MIEFESQINQARAVLEIRLCMRSEQSAVCVEFIYYKLVIELLQRLYTIGWYYMRRCIVDVLKLWNNS